MKDEKRVTENYNSQKKKKSGGEEAAELYIFLSLMSSVRIPKEGKREHLNSTCLVLL